MNDEDKKLIHAIQDLHNAVSDLGQGYRASWARDDYELSNQKSSNSGSTGFNFFYNAFEVILKNQQRQIELLEQLVKNSR